MDFESRFPPLVFFANSTLEDHPIFLVGAPWMLDEFLCDESARRTYLNSNPDVPGGIPECAHGIY